MINDASDSAWRYCENLTEASSDYEKTAAQACLNVLLTLEAFRAGRHAESEIDWGKCIRDLRAALKAAGHPAGDQTAR